MKQPQKNPNIKPLVITNLIFAIFFINCNCFRTIKLFVFLAIRDYQYTISIKKLLC